MTIKINTPASKTGDRTVAAFSSQTPSSRFAQPSARHAQPNTGSTEPAFQEPKSSHFKPNSQPPQKQERQSLRSFLTRTSIILSLVTGFVIIFFFNYQFTNFTQQENEDNTRETFNQATNLIQRGLDQAAGITSTLENSEFITTTLETLQDSAYIGAEHYHASQQLINYLFVMAQESQFIEDILLITDTNQFSASLQVPGFRLNGIEKNPTVSTDYLFYEDEFYTNDIYYQNVPEITQPLPYFQNRLYFVTNITNSNSNQHVATAIVTLNADAILTSFLTPEYYQIRYNNQLLFKGDAYKPTNQDIILTREIQPYDLEIKIQSANYRNPGIQSSLIFIIMMLGLVLILSWPISDYMAKNALTSIYELLDWMAMQQPDRRVKLNKKYSFNMHNRIFLYLIVTTVLPFTFIMVLYVGQFYGNYVQDVQQMQEARVESKVQMVNDEINKLQNVLASLSLNTLPVQEEINTPNNIQRYLSNYQSTLNVRSISLLNNQQEELYRTTTNPHAIQPLINESNSVRTNNGDYEFIFQPQTSDPYGIIKLPIRNPSPTLSNVDTVQIEFDQSYFGDLPLLEEAMSESLLVDQQPIFEFQTSNIVSNQPPTARNLHQVNLPLNIAGWTYQVTFDQTNITSEIGLILSQYFSIFFVLLLILLAVAYFIATNVLKPFSRIVSQRDGLINLDRPSNFLDGIDEVTQIQQNFNDILDELYQLVDEKIAIQENLIKENYEKREIQLFALQNQINPHFLYNALDNLLFLVEDEQTEAAVEMVHSLSNYFQYINNRKDLVVPLWKEIEFTRHYLNIMNARFDNFEVRWDVDPGIANRPIVKLILQPLVENVVHHGVRNVDRMIHLDIFIRNLDQQLEIIVQDDADGIPEEKLQQIQSYLTNPTYNRSGLLNVYDRLTLYYNQDLTFEITSENGDGTRVRIVIPSFVKG
ncbi:sensor histidine kinase [Fundicoccus culcitae]|uniref:Histidine kinase n=1 Tax=Fundicoccus culcitae TaxID=2969821 RepID=A0ABY5P9L4_9LACT|nr:histidine kinase [Fundicoccus culcitae]UUX35290.1 histidine kinase [Fundicoccus culcitae]